MKEIMIVNGKRSISVIRYESGIKIFQFRVWNKPYWCGDGETLRKTKEEAIQDARVRFS